MALYIEERVERLEAHREEDRNLLDTVAAGVANLTVQVQKNQEQTNQRIDELRGEVQEQISGLRNEMNQRFERVEEDIREIKTTLSDVKTTLSLIIKVLDEKL